MQKKPEVSPKSDAKKPKVSPKPDKKRKRESKKSKNESLLLVRKRALQA